jgi:WD40 repeat protein
VAKLSRHRDAIIGAGWIDDERVVSLSLVGALRCWRARSGAAATVVSGFGPWCFGVDYEPGGERYAIGSTEGRLAILDAATHRPLHRLEAGTGRNRAVRWIGEDGLLVVASEDGAVSLIDAANGSVVSAMAEARGSGEAFGIAVHPARRLVATGHADGTIHVWGVDGRGLRHERSLPRLGLRVLGLAFSPDGSTLASTGVSRGVVVWGTSSWERVRTLVSDQVCWPVVFTPDGRRVIAGGFDGRIDAWDAATGVRAAKVDGHERLIAGLGLSRDGAVLATGSDDGLVKVWDASTLRELAVFPTRHNEAIAVAFDPVRSRLAAACQGDATVVWDFDLLDRWIEGNRAYQRGRVGAGEGN